MLTLASAGPTAYWYLTRGTGAVAVILLTLSVALGVANARRVQSAGWPRFVVEAVHRNASLVALAFLVIHIATSLIDGFAPISLIDVVVPFTSAYRPIWLGLGALASDLMLAVVVTSLLRRRLGYGAWRAVHWLAYASWPLAVVHGLGTGSDTKSRWMLVLTAACVLVVVLVVWARASAGWPERVGLRASAITASTLTPIALVVWLVGGPLAPGWARRAGTPTALLPAPTTVARGAARAPAARSFRARLSGSVRQGTTSGGLVEIDLPLTIAGQRLAALDVRIDGQPAAGGGVAMSTSAVTLGTAADPALYRGTVSGLRGTSIAANVSSGSGGSLSLSLQLQIDPSSNAVTGTVVAQPTGRARA